MENEKVRMFLSNFLEVSFLFSILIVQDILIFHYHNQNNYQSLHFFSDDNQNIVEVYIRKHTFQSKKNSSIVEVTMRKLTLQTKK